MNLVADRPDDHRGLSPIVGIVLLFGMVLFGATLVALGGMTLIDTMQSEGSLEQAETSMQQADSDLRDLSFSPDENRTSLKTSDGARLVQDARITLVVNGNRSARSANVTLGSLRYEADNGQTVSLEGGGVFRSVDNGSVVVSRPSLTLRDGRLSFPVTKLDGSVDGSDSLTARKNASSTRSLGSEVLGDEHAPADNVTIVVESKHYDAWGRYLSRQTGTDPTIDHDAERASVTYNLSTDASDDSDAESTPEFDVGFTNYDDPTKEEYIASGSTTTVDVKVSNDGADGETSVALWNSSDQLLGVEDVPEVENGSDRTVTVSFQTDRVEPGVHDLRAEVDGDEATEASLNVTGISGGGTGESTEYTIDVKKDDYYVTEGGTRTISATVSTEGSVEGSTTVALFVDRPETADNRLVDVGHVSVGADDSQTTQFEVDSERLSPGEYELEAVAAGDRDTDSTLRVLADELIWAEDDSPSAETRHHIRYTIEEDLEEADTLEINYPSGSVDASVLENNGASSITGEQSYLLKDDGEATNIPSAATKDIDVSDDGSTIVIDLGSQGNWPEQAETGDQLILSYDRDADIVNPSDEGSYPTTVSLNGDEKTGMLDIGDGDEECVTRLGAACGTLEEDETTNAVEVNQDSASLTFVGSEIAQEIDKDEVERTPLDVVFTLDRSGSMADYSSSSEDFETVTETMTVEEAIADGYITDSDEEFYDYWSGRYVSYDYKMAEGGQMPFVKQGDGSWEDLRYYAYGDYDTTNDGTGEQIHFSIDPETEIQIRESGSDPSEQRIDATESFLDAMNGSAGDRAAVTDFNTRATTHAGLTEPSSARDDLVAYAKGGTSITAGIRNGIDQFGDDSDREKAIVLLSDGENSYRDGDYYTKQAAKDAAEDNISIYTVGLGAADEELLRNVSNTTGGEFYKASDAGELEEKFDQIAGETVQNRTKQIEYQSVTTAVQVGGEVRQLQSDKDDSALNDPNTGPQEYPIDDIDLGSLVSANMASYDCEESEGTGEMVTHDGEQYERTRCVDAGERRDRQDNTNVSHHQIYTAEDDSIDGISDDELAWYQNGPEQLLEEYENESGADLIEDDGTLALSDNQALILVELDGEGAGTDYALMLLETREPDVDSAAEFDVSIDDVPEEVEQGDVAPVTATIENVGDTAGAPRTGVQVEGDDGTKMLTASELSEISSEGERTVTYSVPTDTIEPGDYTVIVQAGDDETESEDELTVSSTRSDPSPEFDVSFASVGDYEANQSSVTIPVEIENTGSTDWETNAGLFVEETGQILGARSSLDVPAGETETVEFEVDPSDFESDGEYTLDVVVEDDSPRRNPILTVTKRPEQDPSVIDAPVDEIELEG